MCICTCTHTHTHTHTEKKGHSKDYCIGVPCKQWMPNMMQRNTQKSTGKSHLLNSVQLVWCIVRGYLEIFCYTTPLFKGMEAPQVVC